MSEPSTGPEPHATPTENERTWGMLAHLAALVGLAVPIVGNVVAPWVVWVTKREQSAFVGEQARESLNFNISVSIAAIVCSLLVLVFVGVLLGMALFVVWLALTLTAAIRASEGVSYHYPFSLRLVK
ncbi:MAG TPA: DUF4870 domain-containing protein [Steroidobacteraceae bacterium]|nr:DUF4870 domain-containing protein [Steroidobacteraceae bacterium]